MKTPKTDSMMQSAGNMNPNAVVVPVEFARRLESALADSFDDAIRNTIEWQDWERWAKEVLADFKIPYDNHKVGMRLAITQWMAYKLHGEPCQICGGTKMVRNMPDDTKVPCWLCNGPENYAHQNK